MFNLSQTKDFIHKNMHGNSIPELYKYQVAMMIGYDDYEIGYRYGKLCLKLIELLDKEKFNILK